MGSLKKTLIVLLILVGSVFVLGLASTDDVNAQAPQDVNTAVSDQSNEPPIEGDYSFRYYTDVEGTLRFEGTSKDGRYRVHGHYVP